jgi:hypothetical protein
MHMHMHMHMHMRMHDTGITGSKYKRTAHTLPLCVS